MAEGRGPSESWLFPVFRADGTARGFQKAFGKEMLLEQIRSFQNFLLFTPPLLITTPCLRLTGSQNCYWYEAFPDLRVPDAR